jgi:mannose-6-phosphate isomerase
VPGPLKLEPIPVARPWGGFALAERYGKPRPAGGEPLGESWEATDVEGRVSRVASGPHKGRTVGEVLGGPLPLLVKLLDCREALSVQVHPDEQAAAEIGGTARPKSEAWHVLAAEPGASIYYGANEGVSTPMLIEACRAGDPVPLLRRVPLVTGDTVFVPAGTVHAIGPGLVLYEVQQPSDTTYRLYDWGRVGLDGRPRALHIDRAAAAIRGPVRGDPRRVPGPVGGPRSRVNLIRSFAFRLDLVLVDVGEMIFRADREPTFLTVVGGDGWVRSEDGEEPVRPGETLAVPPAAAFAVRPGRRGLRLLHARPGRE